MHRLAQLRRDLLEALWRERLESLAHGRRELIHTGRIIYVVVRDIARGNLTLQAMGLVYTTLLSLVPLLAVSFSVLKGFGVHNQLEPLLLNFLAPMGERGVEITERVIGFVSNVKAGVLGSLGLALLFYTVVSLMQKIERAFNTAWRVSDARRLAQRFSDYLSVIVIGPVLIFSAVGLTASAMSNSVVEALRALPFMGLIFEAVGRLIPYLLIVTAFTVIYIFVPNTRVRLRSALLGGAVAGILWETTGWAFAAFIVTSAKYTAIYSAFASLILFMIWLYLGWLILMIGASIAFYHQNPQQMRRRYGVPHLGNRECEALALQTAVVVARAFEAGEDPPDRQALARQSGAAEEAVALVVDALCRAGLLREAHNPNGYVPTRPPQDIRLAALIDAVRSGAIREDALGSLATEEAISQLIIDLDNTIEQHLGERSLHDLVQSPSAAAVTAHQAVAGD